MYRLAILIVLVGMLAAPMAYAQLPDAKVALHIQSHITKGSTCVGYTPATCNTWVTSGNTNVAYDVYVILSQDSGLHGLAGVTLGIAYEGSTVATGSGLWNGGWTLCADLQFPQTDWPETGNGNVITFDAINNCQTNDPGDGTQAMVGTFYLFAYDASQFAIVPSPATGNISVANCQAAESSVPATAGGIVDFGGNLGCNPCLAACVPTPVEDKTWGGIKTQFKDGE